MKEINKNENENENDIKELLYSFQRNEYKETIDIARKIIKDFPDNHLATKALASSLFHVGDLNNALAEINKTIKIAPNDYQAYNICGNIFKEKNNLNEAKNCYENAIKLNINYHIAWNNLGLIFNELNDYPKAFKCFKKAIKIKPNYFSAIFNVGNLYRKINRPHDALHYYKKAELIEPNNFNLLNCMGVISKELGQLENSGNYYTKALKYNPEFAEAHNNLGNLYNEIGDFKNATFSFNRAISINKNSAVFHENLGHAYLKNKQITHAVSCYENALILNPNNDYIKHLLSALIGENLPRANNVYVEKMFDQYAQNFEYSLVKKLNYETPKLLVENLNRYVNPNLKKYDILDLGCGTGLSGLAVKHLSQSLVGVDLSEKMLAKAKEKSIYSKLIKSEISEFLSQSLNDCFNIIISVDVFVYIGELQEIFQRVFNILQINGFFAFSVEALIASDNNKYKLNQNGRYAHSKEYINNLVNIFDFKILDFKMDQIRLEDNFPVMGYIYVLQK